MRPEAEQPDAPRCPACGRFMTVRNERERLVVYECCGQVDTRFRPQFVEPDGAFAGTRH